MQCPNNWSGLRQCAKKSLVVNKFTDPVQVNNVVTEYTGKIWRVTKIVCANNYARPLPSSNTVVLFLQPPGDLSVQLAEPFTV